MEIRKAWDCGAAGCLFMILSFMALTLSSPIGAMDGLNQIGNITIHWDIISWTDDGYNALVTISNYQQYRHIESPGWTLGWNWGKKEVIWEMFGAEANEQGDCSHFKGTNIPHSCKNNPEIVDLLPNVPYNIRTANCCRGGVLSSLAQHPQNSVSSFSMRVGRSARAKNSLKNSEILIKPTKFILKAPGPGYTCGPAQQVERRHFPSSDGRRHTQSILTWKVVCTYSEFVAHQTPVCCLSLSAFYSHTITPCPVCSCGCNDSRTQQRKCVDQEHDDREYVSSTTEGTLPNPIALTADSVRCTHHMCPIRVHWHVKENYRGYWRAKITVTNLNYNMNYSQWNLIVQHSVFNNLAKVFSFNYKGFGQDYHRTNDTAMFWGIKYYNDILFHGGPMGNVQSEMLFDKNRGQFLFNHGEAFPYGVYFNGDECVMPLPDAYPRVPNPSRSQQIGQSFMFIISIIGGTAFAIFLYFSCVVV